MMGGRCNGGAFVSSKFEEQLYGVCRECHFRDEVDGEVRCQVLDGQDESTECPELQEVIRYNEIRLYGVNANERLDNPKRRR